MSSEEWHEALATWHQKTSPRGIKCYLRLSQLFVARYLSQRPTLRQKRPVCYVSQVLVAWYLSIKSSQRGMTAFHHGATLCVHVHGTRAFVK